MSYLPSPIACHPPRSLAEWKSLEKSAGTAKKRSIASYFEQTKDRARSMRYPLAGLTLDLSRHHINSDIIHQLFELAEQAGMPKAISTLFSELPVNHTEGRPALHMTLRGNIGPQAFIDEVLSCHQKMASIVDRIHTGRWTGYSGKAINTIVNIGIGGSDLGPRCAYEALRPYHNSALTVEFVANIDPADLNQVLTEANPETTLFIIASKSFATPETLTNAINARAWIAEQAGPDNDISSHFIAISANIDRATEFGVKPANILPMWDWVGGRFSVWSAIGLPIALATSFKVFEQLLEGARHIDEHFSTVPLNENIPVLLALLEIWYVHFWGCTNVAVLPYDHNLRLLPDHLQQLTMESNGKRVNRDGVELDYPSCPVLWGSAGTIGQHSFHQMLHQGTQMIPVDFILPLSSHENNQQQQAQMVANCLAQAQTLMEGQQADAIAEQLSEEGLDMAAIKSLTPHKIMPGNRPSTVITTDKLTPQSLGAIIALYEHKTFAASVVLGINAFDQWGVELGKKAASSIYDALLNGTADKSNPATLAAIEEYYQLHQNS